MIVDTTNDSALGRLLGSIVVGNVLLQEDLLITVGVHAVEVGLLANPQATGLAPVQILVVIPIGVAKSRFGILDCVIAVFATQGEFFCWVLDDGDPVRTVVKPGRSNDNFVQIAEGLSEGDVVLLYDPSGGEDANGSENGAAE